jgi:hypothetical protein
MKTERYNSFQELEYSGKLDKKQFPLQSVAKYESLSIVQNELYKRCLMGLDFYSPQELYFMNSAKKSKISKRSKLVQENLNLWKQELTNLKINTMLLSLFPKSNLIVDIASNNETDKRFVNTLSFKDLSISKEHVINRLIKYNFLPVNFATL